MQRTREFNWRNVGEIAAVVCVVLSLAFVGFELRLNRSVATSEAVSTSRQISANVNQLIIDNAATWTKACVGEELSLEEKTIFVSIVSAVEGEFLNQWLRNQEGFITPSSLPIRTPTQIMALNMYFFEGFREAWMSRRPTGFEHAGNEDLWVKGILEEYEHFQNNDPGFEVDVALCGKGIY
jgi:hypothetical protein